MRAVIGRIMDKGVVGNAKLEIISMNLQLVLFILSSFPILGVII